MSKLIVLGIDGGSLKLIDQWKDELPNLKKIMEAGVFGELESTIPAMTCPAWPCMFTGKNPGKLGMYDFLNLRLTDESGFKPFSSSDYHTSSLWKILNDHHKKVGLLNVPMTFPPHKINSFMVCGIGIPQPARRSYTYPPELEKTLDEVVGGYVVVPPVILTTRGKEEQYLKIFNDISKKRVKAARYLMSNFAWDLFVCVFFVSDAVQHYFWHHMDASHPRHTDSSKYKDVIKNFYKCIDGAVGILIGEAPEGTNTLIVSDHGFGPIHEWFSVNRWLEEKGFLQLQHRVHQKRMDAGVRKVRDILLPRLNLKLIRLVAGVIPQRLADKLSTRRESGDQMLQMVQNIDWAQTTAYSLGAAGEIFVNLRGRQSHGIVEPGKEYEKVRDKIIDELSKVVNPKTGEPAGFQVFKKEDIYHGHYADLAPDILVVANKYYPVAFQRDSKWSESATSGAHTRQGVFMAYGPEIKKEGLRLSGLKIYDIAPTILHIFGLPIPKDMDGRVLTEVFEKDSEPGQRQITYQEVDYEAERINHIVRKLKRLNKL